MARSILSTTLEFGLVSVPVAVMPVESKGEVEMDRAIPVYDGDVTEGPVDYHPLKRIDVDAHTGLVAEKDEIVKGVFLSKPNKKERETWDDFKAIDPAALEAIEEETKLESFEIQGFMPIDAVPTERVKGCYYLAPRSGGGKQLKLLHDALQATGRAGILKIAIRNRQHPAVVYAKNGGLFMNTLAWAEDFAAANEAGDAFAGASVEPKMTALAVSLIESMEDSGELLDQLADDLRPKQQELLEAALAGEEIKVTPKPKQGKAETDLAAQLEASVLAAAEAKKPAKRKASSKAKAAA